MKRLRVNLKIEKKLKMTKTLVLILKIVRKLKLKKLRKKNEKN